MVQFALELVCAFVGLPQQAIFGEVSEFPRVGAVATFFADKVIAVFWYNIKIYFGRVCFAVDFALDLNGGVPRFGLEYLELDEVTVLPGDKVYFLQTYEAVP